MDAATKGLFCLFDLGPFKTIERKTTDVKECHGKLDFSRSFASATHIAPYFLARAHLTHVHLPDTMRTIPYGAFLQCSGLESVVALGVDCIADRAFAHDTQLKNVHCPNTRSVGKYAFERCAFSAFNASSLQTIGDFAFGWCAQLRSASYPNATVLETGAFMNCSALRHCNIRSAAVIGCDAFKNAKMLKSFFFGRMTERILDNVFEGCTRLQAIGFEAAPHTVSKRAFENQRSRVMMYLLHHPRYPAWSAHSVLKLRVMVNPTKVVSIGGNFPMLKPLVSALVKVAPFFFRELLTTLCCLQRLSISPLPQELWVLVSHMLLL